VSFEDVFPLKQQLGKGNVYDGSLSPVDNFQVLTRAYIAPCHGASLHSGQTAEVLVQTVSHQLRNLVGE
jgi:hypothetical protein